MGEWHAEVRLEQGNNFSPPRSIEVKFCMVKCRFKEHLVGSKGAWSTGSRHPSCVVHPSAIVHDSVAIDANSSIGPMCFVGPGVILGSGVRLQSHVVVHSNTVVGDECSIHAFACVGGDPQDLKYRGGDSWLLLGEKCTVREHATLNRGTELGGRFTTLGKSCLVMSSVHVGHDCQVIFLS
jgi:UDP-N-acetylglucosamine acyltransferase